MIRVDVAYVLLYNEETNQILMVLNKGEGEDPSYFTLPGGAVEQGETLEEAARRETKEETGLNVVVNGIVGITEAFFRKRGHHAVFFIFLGKMVSGEVKISLPEEIEEVVWMDASVAREHIGISNIDVKTVTTIPYFYQGLK
ncbi:NUDIX hydrolase [Sutcliffiella halmapala]|uniref:NUDIX hydrolase n=1 Tax=Sutcliffiella halmapala TaxID=79882 RepID=UPI00099496D2|nr:NUDIX hydrolase [Sutcliffiella halmapala]